MKTFKMVSLAIFIVIAMFPTFILTGILLIAKLLYSFVIEAAWKFSNKGHDQFIFYLKDKFKP
jgi:hypothetical protein